MHARSKMRDSIKIIESKEIIIILIESYKYGKINLIYFIFLSR